MKEEEAEARAEFVENAQRDKGIYSRELRKKGSELHKANITASVEAIKAELDAIEDPEYFAAIIKSEDPQPEVREGDGGEE